ncbi:MAG: biotin--[acetyl-CoA-carboxylase] ligase [Thermoplasmata archaeon]|nr:MAG: biotin--[acetyl-CoA-carboxylase] ligase [Thermoplasmata archaeon]
MVEDEHGGRRLEVRVRGDFIDSNNQNKLLDIDLVQQNLTTSKIGKRIIHLATTPSTNTEAKELLAEGCEEGTAVVADVQTEGRGRLQRTWYSPPGGLWLSVILKPSGLQPEKLPLMSLAAGVAAAKSISSLYPVEVHLKWPNDILITSKKLGGILNEAVYSGTELDGVIIGMGLNLDLPLGDLEEDLQNTATTLRTELPESVEISNEKILAGILNHIERLYDLLISGKHNEIIKEWERYSTTIGSRVSVNLDGDNKLKGEAVGVDELGALMVKTDDGSIHTILAGDCLYLIEEG